MYGKQKDGSLIEEKFITVMIADIISERKNYIYKTTPHIIGELFCIYSQMV